MPPQPEGVTISAEPGEARLPEMGIVPVQQTRMPQKTALWLGYAGCVLAGLLAPSTVIASSALAGFATLMLTVVRDARAALIATGMACLAAVAAGFFGGVGLIPSAIVSLLVASAIGIGLGTGKLTSNAACLLCVGGALVYLGLDAAMAALAGTSLTSLVMTQIEATLEALTEGTSDLEASAQVVRTVVGYIWPSSYTLNVLVGILSAALGARLARTALGPLAPKALCFTEFDLPLWVAGALLASIVGFAIAQLIPAREALLMVAVNLAMAVRFAFGISGTAVAAYFMRRRGLGRIATFVVCCILVFIDMQIFVMAIVGLVDFWANLRHLERGAEPKAETV